MVWGNMRFELNRRQAQIVEVMHRDQLAGGTGLGEHAIAELIADDYRAIDLHGQRETRDSILEVYRPGGVKLEAYDVSEQQVDVFTEVGVINGRGFIRGRFGEHLLEHHVRFTDFYIRRDSRWQLFLSQTTTIEGE